MDYGIDSKINFNIVLKLTPVNEMLIGVFLKNDCIYESIMIYSRKHITSSFYYINNFRSVVSEIVKHHAGVFFNVGGRL